MFFLPNSLKPPPPQMPIQQKPQPFDYQAALCHLEERDARRSQTLAKRLAIAQADAAAIVKMIAEKYRPHRIWQWGSLIQTRHFSEISDIDIGLESLSDPCAIFAVLKNAEPMTDFPLDIVELDRIAPEFADIIRMKGRIIYERQD